MTGEIKNHIAIHIRAEGPDSGSRSIPDKVIKVGGVCGMLHVVFGPPPGIGSRRSGADGRSDRVPFH